MVGGWGSAYERLVEESMLRKRLRIVPRHVKRCILQVVFLIKFTLEDLMFGLILIRPAHI